MCALMALALTHILQMDFMTAYLATSPGGLDTVAIIAAGTPGGYVVHCGATDVAAVYHFTDRPGDGAGYLPLCATAIKKPRRAGAEYIDCPRA